MELKEMENECPICGCELDYENVELNELLPCPDCGSDLEVVNLDPFTLDRAPMEQEDWGE
jgi:alpha-aminoadipate carrier protein LysW